jgi:site-specific recombinase XerD
MPEQALTTRQAGELVTTSPRPADQNPAAVYVAHLAEGGRPTMRQALNVIAGMLTSGRCDASTLEWGALRYQHTAAIRAALAGQYAPATVNKMLSALRGTLKAAWRLGQMDATAYQQAADLEPVKGSTLPRGRALSAGELRALFDTCAGDPSPAGARDAALFAILYAGLRRSEAVALDLADYDPEAGALTVRAGKGHKDRTTYTDDGGREALADWLAIRGQEPGPLLYPIRKGGRLQRRRMSGDAVLEILSRRAERACVAACSPHDLRRTWIGDLLDAGADIATVQALAGHENVQTTARYDRRPEATKRRAGNLLHVPYTRRPRLWPAE